MSTTLRSTWREPIQNSCNAYFCYVFRNVIENKKYGDIDEGFDLWADYVRSFGYGRKLGSDFTGELNGNVPGSGLFMTKPTGEGGTD